MKIYISLRPINNFLKRIFPDKGVAVAIRGYSPLLILIALKCWGVFGANTLVYETPVDSVEKFVVRIVTN